MKKGILLAVAIMTFGFANAQDSSFGFAKGNVIVEGRISFGSNKKTNSFAGTNLDETKTSSINFNPKLGYFIGDKLALGVELDVFSGKRTQTDFTVTPNDVNELKTDGFAAGVFARYYFLDLGQRFKTYAEAGLGFGSSKTVNNSVETLKTSSVGFGIDLGMNYFLTNRFAISFGLNNVLSYSSSTSKTPGGGETKSNDFSGDLNVFRNFFDTPAFGLTYKF
jgi:outer membrane protein